MLDFVVINIFIIIIIIIIIIIVIIVIIIISLPSCVTAASKLKMIFLYRHYALSNLILEYGKT